MTRPDAVTSLVFAVVVLAAMALLWAEAVALLHPARGDTISEMLHRRVRTPLGRLVITPFLVWFTYHVAIADSPRLTGRDLIAVAAGFAFGGAVALWKSAGGAG